MQEYSKEPDEGVKELPEKKEVVDPYQRYLELVGNKNQLPWWQGVRFRCQNEGVGL